MDTKEFKKQLKELKEKLDAPIWENFEAGGEYESGYEPLASWITEPFYGVTPDNMDAKDILLISGATLTPGMTKLDYVHFLDTIAQGYRGVVIVDSTLDTAMLTKAAKFLPTSFLVVCTE
jgi:hypothetical protein